MKIEKIKTYGWEGAIRGMRNSRKSWDKSDSELSYNSIIDIGENDLKLASKLAKAGSSEAKFRRMIHVQMDITAPLYWWKEFETYKVGVTSNSESTMYSITDEKFTIDNFERHNWMSSIAGTHLINTINDLNNLRELYLKEENVEDKKMYWKDIIQILPCSYKQLRTIDTNYEVISKICKERKGHKLPEWGYFLFEMRRNLPYAKQLIFCEE